MLGTLRDSKRKDLKNRAPMVHVWEKDRRDRILPKVVSDSFQRTDEAFKRLVREEELLIAQGPKGFRAH